MNTPMTGRPIAFLIAEFHVGGAERVAVTLANGFLERGRSVDFCVLCEYQEILPVGLAPAVRKIDFRASRMRYALGGLIGYLRRERPRALVCIMRYAVPLAILARALARTSTPIVFMDCTFALGNGQGEVPEGYRFLRWQLRQLNRRVQKLIVPSQTLADDLVRHGVVASRDIAIIATPAAAPVFEDTSPQMEVLHNWPDGEVIVTVCRLDTNKDVATLLRAFAVLRENRPSLTLAVIGDGPERPHLEALARELGCSGRVHFYGAREKPWRYMKRAAVFVLASHQDVFPGVVIEALAVGCPVVATDAQGGTRDILDEGRFGTLVPPADAAAMASAIADALDQPSDPRRLIERARQFAAGQIDAHFAEIESVAR